MTSRPTVLKPATPRPLGGLSFPFRLRDGSVVRAMGEEKLAQNLRQLLATRRGERAMLRTYGGGVHHRLQEPGDAALRALVRHEIEEALALFLPELRLVAPVEVSARGSVPTGSVLTVAIEYTADPGDVIRRLEMELS